MAARDFRVWKDRSHNRTKFGEIQQFKMSFLFVINFAFFIKTVVLCSVFGCKNKLYLIEMFNGIILLRELH